MASLGTVSGIITTCTLFVICILCLYFGTTLYLVGPFCIVKCVSFNLFADLFCVNVQGVTVHGG